MYLIFNENNQHFWCWWSNLYSACVSRSERMGVLLAVLTDHQEWIDRIIVVFDDECIIITLYLLKAPGFHFDKDPP